MEQSVSAHNSAHDGQSMYLSAIEQTSYRIPAMPKLSIIVNINAAILAAIMTVVFTIIDQHKFIDTVVRFSSLILCFTFGSAVSLLSCAFDYKARKIYDGSASKKVLLLDVAEIFDMCAFMIFVASLAIFVWGAYMGFYLVRGAIY